MAEANAKAVLEAAWGMIDSPKTWTKREMARDVNGKRADPKAKKAVSWCVHGAVRRVAPNKGVVWQAIRLLNDALPNSFRAGRGTRASDLIAYNDRLERTHAEMRKLFKRAIELAGKKKCERYGV